MASHHGHEMDDAPWKQHEVDALDARQHHTEKYITDTFRVVPTLNDNHNGRIL